MGAGCLVLVARGTFRGADANGLVTGRPVVGGAVVVAQTGRALYGIDRESGRVRWERSFPEDAILGATEDVLVLRGASEYVARRL